MGGYCAELILEICALDGVYSITMQGLANDVRTGYPLAVISRQGLLRSLFDHLCDKERVLFSKRVIQVIPGASRVTVHCQDGSSISGDIVVGADGIHSVTRRQMLQYIHKQKYDFQRPNISFSTTYSGLFGTSSPTPGLQPGEAHRTYGHGWSMIVTIGHDETVYWYVAIKFDGSRIPRHQTDTYIDTIVAPFLQKHVTAHVHFGDVFKNTISSRHVPLEESLEWQWSWGRIACIGDAVHKMTPNIAQGANCAIETAATLANHLISIANKPEQPREDILGKWYSSHWWRMKLFYISSQTLIRVEASTTFIARLLGLYIGFFHGELVMGMLSDISWFTARLDHLPLPQVKEDRGKDRKVTSWNDMCCSTMCMVLPLGIIVGGVYVMGSAIRG
ncbi:hypothetical protein AWENTII_009206 [Aspergillus wentii]